MVKKDLNWIEAAAVFGMDRDEAVRQTATSLSRRRNQLIKQAHPDVGGSNEQAQPINDAYAVLRDWIKDGKPGLTDEPTREAPAAAPKAEPPPTRPSPPEPEAKPPPTPPPPKPEPPSQTPPPQTQARPSGQQGKPPFIGRFYQRPLFRMGVAAFIIGAAIAHQFWTGGEIARRPDMPPPPIPELDDERKPQQVTSTTELTSVYYEGVPFEPNLPRLLSKYHAIALRVQFRGSQVLEINKVEVRAYTAALHIGFLQDIANNPDQRRAIAAANLAASQTPFLLICTYLPQSMTGEIVHLAFWFERQPLAVPVARQFPFGSIGAARASCPRDAYQAATAR